MNPTALITGGTRGIGLGIAEALAGAGYDLLLCGRRPESELTDTLGRLESRGVRVTYARADVGRTADRERLVDTARSALGRLDLLVNNAGMAPRRRTSILEATEASFEEVMRVNLQGPYFLTQRCAHWMIESAGEEGGSSGCIVNIGSISATVASITRGEYCVSKAGLAMATRLWAVALAPHGIPVYEIRPGLAATDMTAGVREKYDALIAGGLLLQPRWGTPEDVGRAVLMLARGDLAYATGQVITLDGGLTLERL